MDRFKASVQMVINENKPSSTFEDFSKDLVLRARLKNSSMRRNSRVIKKQEAITKSQKRLQATLERIRKRKTSAEVVAMNKRQEKHRQTGLMKAENQTRQSMNTKSFAELLSNDKELIQSFSLNPLPKELVRGRANSLIIEKGSADTHFDRLEQKGFDVSLLRGLFKEGGEKIYSSVEVRKYWETLRVRLGVGRIGRLTAASERLQARKHAYLKTNKHRQSLPNFKEINGGDKGDRNAFLENMRAYYLGTLEVDQDFSVQRSIDKEILEREALKFHPDVLLILQQIWTETDADGSGYVDLEEYQHLFEVLYVCVRGEKADKKLLTEMAEREFELDAAGEDSLDKFRFYQCFFQLTDTW